MTTESDTDNGNHQTSSSHQCLPFRPIENIVPKGGFTNVFYCRKMSIIKDLKPCAHGLFGFWKYYFYNFLNFLLCYCCLTLKCFRNLRTLSAEKWFIIENIHPEL